MTWRRGLGVATILVLVAALAWRPSARSTPPGVSVFGSLATVRLDLPTPTRGAATSAKLLAARDEFESFQVVVDSGSSALQGLRVARAGALHGPGGAVI